VIHGFDPLIFLRADFPKSLASSRTIHESKVNERALGKQGELKQSDPVSGTISKFFVAKIDSMIPVEGENSEA
jgi:hypothetical protein